MKSKHNSVKTTSIGGQAVIEGVMMRGTQSMATAVRDTSGNIILETKRLKPTPKRGFKNFPIVRGVIAFFNSLVGGTKSLIRSASVFGEEESSDFDKWLSKKTGANSVDIAVFFGVFLGLVLSLFLFFFLPQWIADLFTFINNTSILYYLIEGLIRIIIFISYILLTSFVKDVKRTYMYHGAEHKTISCYESGLELTVENVKKCSRVHDRCGTTFMFLVMIISILIFALANQIFISFGVVFNGVLGKLWRFLCKLAMLPIVAGSSYEILKLLALTRKKWTLIFKAPGLLLQKITTKEPDDEMIEVAITAFNKVLEMDADESIPEVTFNVFGNASTLLDKVSKFLKANGVLDSADAEWIVAVSLDIPRSKVKDKNVVVTKQQFDKALELTKKRAQKFPLWYVVGNTDFYGYKLTVNEDVLIPRPETEELVNLALKSITSQSNVLDLCTGSGAIAIVVNKESNACVTAVDVSKKALAVAKQNAQDNGAEINFVESDMFENLNDEFDVIISNPPYIKSDEISSLSDEVKREPRLALDGGQDGLDKYRIICKNAYKFLKNNGILFLEIGNLQAQEVLEIFAQNNKYKNAEVIKDLSGNDRIFRVQKNA